jgi:hypothetical protein
MGDSVSRKDYGALDIALVIEVVGAAFTIWFVTRKTPLVLTITKDGLLRHRRRKGLFRDGTPVPEVFIKWSEIACLEAGYEMIASFMTQIITGGQVIPLKYIRIFLRNPQSPPVICDVEKLSHKPAEILSILNSCVNTFGTTRATASPPGVVDASSLDTLPKGPVEIRFGKRNAMIYLAEAIFSGFLGGGFIWFGMFSAHGLWNDFANEGLKDVAEVALGLFMSGFGMYHPFHGCRGLLNRWPQLIVGEFTLTYRRLALSIPWCEINPDQLRFSFMRSSRCKGSMDILAKICVTFNGSKDPRLLAISPVVLDVSKLDRPPEDIYSLIKARALKAKKQPSLRKAVV